MARATASAASPRSGRLSKASATAGSSANVARASCSFSVRSKRRASATRSICVICEYAAASATSSWPSASLWARRSCLGPTHLASSTSPTQARTLVMAAPATGPGNRAWPADPLAALVTRPIAALCQRLVYRGPERLRRGGGGAVAPQFRGREGRRGHRSGPAQAGPVPLTLRPALRASGGRRSRRRRRRRPPPSSRRRPGWRRSPPPDCDPRRRPTP